MVHETRFGRDGVMSGVSRRNFLKRSTAAGVTAGTAGLWLPQAYASAPKRGGHAVFAVGNASTTDTFDPLVTPALFVSTVRCAIHDTLFEIASDGRVVPSLAESWDISDDVKTWVVKLKPGITFHDGREVTAQDVVASVALHRQDGSPMQNLIAHLADMRVDGDSVVFELSEADADWHALLAEYMMSILPSEDGVADWQSGIGCGPYKLLNFDPGLGANVERYTGDHRDDRGWFDSVELIAVNDTVARMNALQSGQADVISRIELKLAAQIEASEGIRVVSRTSPGFYTYDMQVDMAPMDQNNVRLALKHAIDRELFVNMILAGHGSVGNDQPIGPTYAYHADLPQTPYDPDKARHHLKQAGLENIALQLVGSDGAFEGSVDGAALYAETAAPAGIEIEPIRAPADGYWSDVWGQVPFFAVYWTGRPTEALIISLAYGSGASWNVTGWGSSRVDELVQQARGELDDAKRGELFAEAQMILRDDGPSVLPAFFNSVDAVSDTIGVTDTTVSSTWLDGRYAVSRWWFK